MPIQTRSHRSLLALAMVAVLVAASSPVAARSDHVIDLRAPDRDDAAVLGARSSAPVVDYDRGPSLRGLLAPRAARPAGADDAKRSDGAATRTDWIRRATPDVPEPKPKTQSTAEAATGGSGNGGAASYRGRNHVWIPALGIDRSVTGFSCSSSAYPGDRVYRWGCAGRNNIYLFGHAHSVFKPLHDAYVRGRLKKGMKVYYADGKGKVSTYTVRWWKVTTPDKGAWAYAAQSKPSLTLQTCVGARSQYRLIVRLVKVG